MIRERLLMFLINIFCPPVTVMAIAGVGADCLLNTILFLLGVIPGHIHGFYITCTYFSRKSKVRKGQYPGGPKMGIYSERVWYGGASSRRIDELWEKRESERVENWRRKGEDTWGKRVKMGETMREARC
ncbi:plasma membrane proteolipid 3 [Botrytis cinerea]